MELLLKNSPNAGYSTYDVVYIAPDGHAWGGGELDANVFTIVKNITLTELQKQLLVMPDVQLNMPKSALNIPAQRRSIMNTAKLKRVGRRRYHAPGGNFKRK